MHYLLLLFVPIALYRPRLSGLWFLPLLLWLTPSSNSHGDDLADRPRSRRRGGRRRADVLASDSGRRSAAPA